MMTKQEQSHGDQLREIMRQAVINTRARPATRRGPYVISDEFLDASIAAIIADETQPGPEDQANIAMVKTAIASAESSMTKQEQQSPSALRISEEVWAAHAQFGGDPTSMQKCYEWSDLKAENKRLREALEKASAFIARYTQGAGTETIRDAIGDALKGDEQ